MKNQKQRRAVIGKAKPVGPIKSVEGTHLVRYYIYVIILILLISNISFFYKFDFLKQKTKKKTNWTPFSSPLFFVRLSTLSQK